MSNEDTANSDEDRQKNIAYYSACVNAWLNTRFELDKSIINLSAGGVGLLVTLLTAIGFSSTESLILYILSLACYMVAIIGTLFIFRLNSDHLEKVVAFEEKESQILGFLDLLIIISFIFGALCTSILGVVTAINSNKSKTIIMPTNSSKQPHMVFDSVNTISKLSVSSLKKSTNGVEAIQQKPADVQEKSAPSNNSSSEKTNTSNTDKNK